MPEELTALGQATGLRGDRGRPIHAATVVARELTSANGGKSRTPTRAGTARKSPPEPPPEPAPIPQTTAEVVPIDARPDQNRKPDLESPERKEDSQQAQNSGLLDRLKIESVPKYKACQGDIVRGGKNNQWIVFGRDRPGGYTSGYGPGEGDSQAAAIDIVVGRMAPHPRMTHRDGESFEVGPIFNYDNHEGRKVCDAGRIYMSQKTDMDHNFKLAAGRIGKPKARSGICLKSDGIRIIARDSGIKLVTHSPGMMNSQGGTSAKSASGIDLIAGNDDTNLQPMILGDNLYACLQDYAIAIDQVVGTLASLIENVAQLDVALSTHIHPQSYPAGVPNIPSPNLAAVTAASLAKLVSLDTFSTYAEKWKLETIE